MALVGIPNSGKTSLFNAVTGQKLGVGNWPGTSVEVGRGRWRGTPGLDVIDLPGAYSLQARWVPLASPLRTWSWSSLTWATCRAASTGSRSCERIPSG